MRLAVYTDYAYSEADGVVYGQRAFVLFLCELREHVEHLQLMGRLGKGGDGARYVLPDGVGFTALPYYPSLARPARALPAVARSLRRVWRALDDVDSVWLLGPSAPSMAYVALAAMRRKAIVLGVRQEIVPYTRNRHPGRRLLHLAAMVEDAIWRALARRLPTVVVGPSLAQSYRHARALLPISVSLIAVDDILDPAAERERNWDGELRLLTVGRLEVEKNPLLLAEILAGLRKREPRWRLIVCGEGPLRPDLANRLNELGVAGHAELLGYVPFHDLRAVYRGAHAFLHVSHTEGVPQVVFEAFAAALPVVATSVGGVAQAVGEAALLVPPADAHAAIAAVEQLAADGALRETLVARGNEIAHRHTRDAEVARLADFISGGGRGGRQRGGDGSDSRARGHSCGDGATTRSA